MNKKAWVVALLFIMIITGSAVWAGSVRLSAVQNASLLINEVCSNNFSLIKDKNNAYPDYIEIYNPTSEPMSLEGYYLSDDKMQLYKYTLGTELIQPGEHLLFWLDGRDYEDLGRIGFQISKEGDTVFLSKENRPEPDDFITVPALSYNTSYGRVTDGGSEWSRMSATAGVTNQNAKLLPARTLSPPSFSVESGFYDDAFPLTITAAEGETVYYTLDGSDPLPGRHEYRTALTIDDATGQENVYAARTDIAPARAYIPPFQVDKATIVRAVSYNHRDNTVSDIITKVYFVGFDTKTDYLELPVLSLVSDPANLFGLETGIYGAGIKLEEYKAAGGEKDGKLLEIFTDDEGNEQYLYAASNAFNSGKEWEREATVSYFNEAHQYLFTSDVGIRIAGASTRSRLKKSFNFYGRDIYDENIIFPYEFFPGMDYSTIRLRNGGNNNDTVMFTDAFLAEQAIGRDVSVQRAKPCILFLNGEYWGLYHVRERFSEEYFRNYYGIHEDNLWVIDDRSVRIGSSEAYDAFQAMITLICECDLTYDDVYEMICENIDVQSLIDYLSINLLIDNRDITPDKNSALWRTIAADGSEYGDGRWRWLLYDLDISLHEDSNSLPRTWMAEHVLLTDPMVVSLMRNEQFRRQFSITLLDLANTSYSYENMQRELKEWQQRYTTPMVANHRRFINADFTPEDYAAYVSQMDQFFRQRLPFLTDSIAEYFQLTGTPADVTIHCNLPEAGMIKVNTAWIEGTAEWQGTYFTDYPLTLTAEAAEGYRFVGWRGDAAGSDERIEVNIPAEGLSIWADFEKINQGD